MTEELDFELHRKWVEGDKQAGVRLVNRHYRRVSHYFGTSLGDAERLDLTQETFTRLTRVKDRFGGRASFKAFLFGIARNVLNEFLRERYKTGIFDPLTHTLEDVQAVSASQAISQLAHNQDLFTGLQSLPVETKHMLELYYWQDLTAAEVGEIHGIPEATVRTRIHSAKKQLAKHVEKSGASFTEVEIENQVRKLGQFLGFGPLDSRETPEPRNSAAEVKHTH